MSNENSETLWTLQSAVTWMYSGSHWIFSLLGSTEPSGHFISTLWGLPPNLLILFTKFSVRTWWPSWKIHSNQIIIITRPSFVYIMNYIFLKRVTYLLLDQTSSVADSKKKVVVRVFVQWESTGRQLQVELIQRSQVDLQKDKGDVEAFYLISMSICCPLLCQKELPRIFKAPDSQSPSPSILTLWIRISM